MQNIFLENGKTSYSRLLGFYISVFLDCTKSAYVRNVKITFFNLIWSYLGIFAPNSDKTTK